MSSQCVPVGRAPAGEDVRHILAVVMALGLMGSTASHAQLSSGPATEQAAIAPRFRAPSALEKANIANLTEQSGRAASTGDYALAERAMRDVLDIESRTYGPDHPEALGSRAQIAQFQALQRDFSGANDTALAALAEMERQSQRSPISYALVQNVLGRIASERTDTTPDHAKALWHFELGGQALVDTVRSGNRGAAHWAFAIDGNAAEEAKRLGAADSEIAARRRQLDATVVISGRPSDEHATAEISLLEAMMMNAAYAEALVVVAEIEEIYRSSDRKNVLLLARTMRGIALSRTFRNEEAAAVLNAQLEALKRCGEDCAGAYQNALATLAHLENRVYDMERATREFTLPDPQNGAEITREWINGRIYLIQVLREQRRFGDALPLIQDAERRLAWRPEMVEPMDTVQLLHASILNDVYSTGDRIRPYDATAVETILAPMLARPAPSRKEGASVSAVQNRSGALLVLANARLMEGDQRGLDDFDVTAAYTQREFGPRSSEYLHVLEAFITLLGMSREWEYALPQFPHVIELNTHLYGPSSVQVLNARSMEAFALAGVGRNREALERLEPLCGEVRAAVMRATSSGVPSASANAVQDDAAACYQTMAMAYLGSLKAASAEDRERLRSEAFSAFQRGMRSSAGDAMAGSGSRRLALALGAGDLLAGYERAQSARDRIDRQLTEAASLDGESGVRRRQDLLEQRRIADRQVDETSRNLQKRFPDYWRFLWPEPLSVARLQATSGKNAMLLRGNEAVLLFVSLPGDLRGTVFAVSKRGFASATMSKSGAEVRALVESLRSDMDRCGSEKEPGACESGDQRFDMAKAHELYVALMGAPEIDRVINAAGIDTLLIVPSGPLSSLPPGLLVTRPATSERRAGWLIDAKAIALLPSVAALEGLRSRARPAMRAGASGERLFAMADPDYAGTGAVSVETCPPIARAAPQAKRVARGDTARPEIARLPRLPCTRDEANALRNLVRGDIFLGTGASEATLRDPRVSQLLARATVVSFATHGLTIGDLGAGEPALALAAPNASTDDDGLLTASEAASLRLSAEWVLLSACNTASPDAPEGYGLSGLSSAFFFAGARSVLASHWRVDDAATRTLMVNTIALSLHGVSKAQALRQASCALREGVQGELNSRRDYCDVVNLGVGRSRYAHPAYWAPFTLIGSPT